MKIELIDLPFTDGRRFRLRVNGRWAAKLPVASKTAVLKELRGWWVRHEFAARLNSAMRREFQANRGQADVAWEVGSG